MISPLVGNDMVAKQTNPAPREDGLSIPTALHNPVTPVSETHLRRSAQRSSNKYVTETQPCDFTLY